MTIIWLSILLPLAAIYIAWSFVKNGLQRRERKTTEAECLKDRSNMKSPVICVNDPNNTVVEIEVGKQSYTPEQWYTFMNDDWQYAVYSMITEHNPNISYTICTHVLTMTIYHEIINIHLLFTSCIIKKLVNSRLFL